MNWQNREDKKEPGQMLKRKLSTRNGFTILELMLAVLILLTAILGLLVVFINCMFLSETNRNMVTATNDAQYILEQIKSTPYASIQSYAPPDLDNLPNENIAFQATAGTRITQVDVTISWTERGRNKNLQLSTSIAQ